MRSCVPHSTTWVPAIRWLTVEIGTSTTQLRSPASESASQNGAVRMSQGPKRLMS